MSDASLNYFVARGTNAERLAFTPSPPTPASGPDPLHIFYETDTNDTYGWDGSAWDKLNNSSGSVTTTGSPSNGNLTKFSGAATVTNGDLSGDVSTSGSLVTAIGAGKVTLAMQANMATASIVYRKTAGAGAPEVQTLATLKTDLGLTGTNSGDQTIALTGDVTGAGTGSFATAIANDSVTLAKIANASANSKLLGSGAAGSGADYSELTLGTNLSMSGTTLNAAGGGWQLAGTGQTATGIWDFAVDGAKTNIDFSGLSSFTEFMIIGRGVTRTNSTVSAVRVSVASTFYSASGDYVTVAATGITTNVDWFGSHSTNSTAARDFFVHILPSVAGLTGKQSRATDGVMREFVGASGAIDALRCFAYSGGTTTGGVIYCLAR